MCVRAACVRAYMCVDHVISVHVLSYTSSVLTEDRLAFRVSFVNNESFHFCVAKPCEWKSWVERVEMVGALWLEHCMDVDDCLSLSPSLPSLPPSLPPIFSMCIHQYDLCIQCNYIAGY